MTINARLDEIAKEAAEHWETSDDNLEPTIRAAINKALEVVLTAEPSEKMLARSYTELAALYHGDGGWIGRLAGDEQSKLTYRAMSSALLEELKNETPGS